MSGWTAERLDAWLEDRLPRSMTALEAAVSAVDLVHRRPEFGQIVRPARGSVLASRIRARWDPAPDYVFHWVRDAAVAMLAAPAAMRAGRTGWEERFADHVSFSLRISERPGPPRNPLRGGTRADHLEFLRPDAELAALKGAALLDEPRAGADGAPDYERWARPQFDGPALRALSCLRWPGEAPEGMDALVARDLGHVLDRAALPCIGPWEEDGEIDLHAFTMMAQRAALDEAARRGVLDEAEVGEAVARLDAALEGLRTPGGWMRARGAGADADAAVVLGALLARSRGRFGPDDPGVLASAARIEAWSLAAFPSSRPALPGIGRSPEDRFFGGNPWLPTTLGFAELHYRLASDPPDVAPEAFRLSLPPHRPEDLRRALAAKGDRFLAFVACHAPADGTLPEQIGGGDGRPTSCPDLAWSHAALIAAAEARQAARGALTR